MKHFYVHEQLSSCQYSFHKSRSTGNLLTFLSDSWSLGGGEVRPIYPSLCSLVSNFLYDRSVTTVVDGHCSPPTPITSGILQSSVPSPTLFILFINELIAHLPLYTLMLMTFFYVILQTSFSI